MRLFPRPKSRIRQGPPVYIFWKLKFYFRTFSTPLWAYIVMQLLWDYSFGDIDPCTHSLSLLLCKSRDIHNKQGSYGNKISLKKSSWNYVKTFGDLSYKVDSVIHALEAGHLRNFWMLVWGIRTVFLLGKCTWVWKFAFCNFYENLWW